MLTFISLCTYAWCVVGTESPTSSPTNFTDAGLYGGDVVPYSELSYGTVSTWLTFLIVCVASAQLGGVVSHVGLPLISGYMVVGVVCGPDVLGMITTDDLVPLGLVTQMALSFICLSAGAELYLPELRSLFRPILWLTATTCFFTFLLSVGGIYGIASMLPFWKDLSTPCKGSVASIAAAITASSSPASAIAIVREMKAKGVFTSKVLGVTVLGDVFVILLFSLATSLARTTCNNDPFDGITFLVTLGTILASLVVGFIVGQLLTVLFAFRFVIQRILVLPLGLAIFMGSSWLSDWSQHRYRGFTLNMEPLLICIVAGYICTNRSAHRARFLSILSSLGPYVFLPFFTRTGATLQLTVLADALGFAALVGLYRVLCLFIGSSLGGYLGKTRPFMRTENITMWMCLITQAGVSLGLASEVGVIFPPDWGRTFQTALLTCIILNQLIGPIFFRYALVSVGEAWHRDDAEVLNPDASLPRVLVVGRTPSAMAVAATFLKDRWNVTMLCASEDNAQDAREQIHQFGVETRKQAEAKLAEEQKAKEKVLTLKKKQIGSLADKVLSEAKRMIGQDVENLPSPNNQDQQRLESRFTAIAVDLDLSGIVLRPKPKPCRPKIPRSPGGPLRSGSSGGEEEMREKKIDLEHEFEKNVENEDKDSEFDSTTLKMQLSQVIHAPEMRNLAAIVLGLMEDQYSLEIAKVLRQILREASTKSTLHAVRLLALLRSPFWGTPLEDIGVMPLHPEMHSSYMAAKLLSAPFTKPICVHPSFDLMDLCHVVGETLRSDMLKRFVEQYTHDTGEEDDPLLLEENLAPFMPTNMGLVRQLAAPVTSVRDTLKRQVNRFTGPHSPSSPNRGLEVVKEAAKRMPAKIVHDLRSEIGHTLDGGERVGDWPEARTEYVEQLCGLDENTDFNTGKEYL